MVALEENVTDVVHDNRPQFLNLDSTPVPPDPLRVELAELIRLFHGWWLSDQGAGAIALVNSLDAAGRFRVKASGRLDAYFLQHLRGGYYPRSKQLQGLGKHPDEHQRKDVRKTRDGLEFDHRYMTVLFAGLVLRGCPKIVPQTPSAELWDDYADETARVMRNLAQMQRGNSSTEEEESGPVSVELSDLVKLAASEEPELAVRVRTFVETKAVPTPTVFLHAISKATGSQGDPARVAASAPGALSKLFDALELLATQYERGEAEVVSTGPTPRSTSKLDYRALSAHLSRTEAFMGLVEQVRRVSFVGASA